MTAEDRVKQIIGELHFQIALLSSKLEEAQAKILQLEEKMKADASNVPPDS